MTGPQQPQVLVTGAASTLARKVIMQLKESCGVVAVDFREQVRLGNDIPSYCIDINQQDFGDLFRRYPFDGIVHLGRAMPRPGHGPDRHSEYVHGTRKLLDLSLEHKVHRVIILSTYHVYGASPANPVPIDETMPPKALGLPPGLAEQESLLNTYLWRYPHLNMTVLRPCNIAGPGVRNTISTLLAGSPIPVLAGFSPMMQFLHIDDMADAVIKAWHHNHRGIYNVAPEDWVAYQRALVLSGCTRLPLPSMPPVLPHALLQLLNLRYLPPNLMDFFRYPVIIDGRRFAQEFGFQPRHSLGEIFRYYRKNRHRGHSGTGV